MILKKFATLFLWVFVILPIYEAHFYHGYNSYKQYYNNEMKYPVIDDTFKQTNYDHEIQKKVNRFKDDNNHADFVFSYDNGFQMRNDINNKAIINNPTPCNNNEYFCEVDPKNYPQDDADDILNRNPTLTHLKFNINKTVVLNGSEQNVRFDGNSEHSLCISQNSSSICPNKAKTINDTWMWIIQSSRFKQLISYISCEEDTNGNGTPGTKDNTCRFVSKNDINFNPICKQMYSNFSLLAFNSNGHGMAVFKFPSYCCCNNCFNNNCN